MDANRSVSQRTLESAGDGSYCAPAENLVRLKAAAFAN